MLSGLEAPMAQGLKKGTGCPDEQMGGGCGGDLAERSQTPRPLVSPDGAEEGVRAKGAAATEMRRSED